MTESTSEAIAKRAVACKRWRWMPGMRAVDTTGEEHPARVIDARRSVVYEDSDGAMHEGVVSRSDVPDLTDPATLGCLLALVRKAWDMPRIATFCADGWWGVHSPTLNICFPIRDKKDNSEAAALVKALELASQDTEAEALVAALEAAE